MLKAIKEVRQVIDMNNGAPFDPAAFIAGMRVLSADYAKAAEAIISLHAIKLDCGKVVIPA